MSIGAVAARFSATRGIVRRAAPLLVVAFCADAAFAFIFLIALQSYLPESMHASVALAGYALAAFGAAKLLSQVLSGMVCDRFGARRAMVGGTALLVVADASMLPLAHVAPSAIIAAAALEGLGSSVLWPAVYAAGAARFPDGEKTRFTALLTLATVGALGVALGGGALLEAAAPFTIAMLFPIAFVALALIVALVAPEPRARSERGDEPAPSLRALGRVLRSPERAMFSAVVLAEAMALGALTAIFRAYGRDILDVSLLREGLMLAPAALAGAGCVLIGGTIADRAGARAVMAPGFALAGAATVALAFATHAAAVVPLAAAGAAGFGIAVPTIASTMLALSREEASRGGVIGWFMSMDGIGHAVGPVCAAVLLATTGAEVVMILSGVGFLAVGVIAVAMPLVVRTSDEPAATARPVIVESASAPMRMEVGQ